MVGVMKCADEEEIIIVPTLRKARLEHHFRRQKIGFIGDKMVFGDSFSADKMDLGDSFRRLFSKFERRKRRVEEKEEEERAKRPKKPRTTENDLRQMLLYFAADKTRMYEIDPIKQEDK